MFRVHMASIERTRSAVKRDAAGGGDAVRGPAKRTAERLATPE
jgi:hypothetical protein